MALYTESLVRPICTRVVTNSLFAQIGEEPGDIKVPNQAR